MGNSTSPMVYSTSQFWASAPPLDSPKKQPTEMMRANPPTKKNKSDPSQQPPLPRALHKESKASHVYAHFQSRWGDYLEDEEENGPFHQALTIMKDTRINETILSEFSTKNSLLESLTKLFGISP